MKMVGIWMYQNGGGTEIEKKLVSMLRERDILSVTDLDLKHSYADNGEIFCNNINMCELDLFFSYNAGEQSVAQMYMYEVLNRFVPTINNFKSFQISEDKFKTSMVLHSAGVKTADFFLCHRDRPDLMVHKFEEWEKMVFKPLDGWGGTGMALLDNHSTLDTLLPFLNQTDIRQMYIERFVNNDFTDYRVDIVDGHFVAVYGRKAGERDWRTNITSGGSIILREENEEVINLALKASQAIGLEIAGVDIIYDKEHEEYIVLEVNGIPAFATPQQEELGLDFNDKKLELIVDLIDRTVNNNIKED